MSLTECSINPNKDAQGIGTVIITDAHLLIRPAVPGQYPASVTHDSAHAYRILHLGNDMYNQEPLHIICQEDAEAAHKLLDRVFYAYVDACCMELWCDACVYYIVDDKIVHEKEYGFDDGHYTMAINVYCGIAADQTERFVSALKERWTDNLFVIRPDSSEQGFNVHAVTDSEEEDSHDADWEQDPLADDVDPTGGYYEPEEQQLQDTPFIPLGQ